MMHCINCAMFCEIILVSINVLYYFSYSSLCSFKAMLFTIDRKNFCYSFFVHRLFNTSCNNTVFIFITLQLYLYRYLYFSAPDPYLWSLALAPNFFFPTLAPNFISLVPKYVFSGPWIIFLFIHMF